MVLVSLPNHNEKVCNTCRVESNLLCKPHQIDVDKNKYEK